MFGAEFLSNAFGLMAMEEENQKQERQKNIIGSATIEQVIPQPPLDEIDGAACGANQIGMNCVRLGWRPLLNRISCCDLRHDIDTEECKDNLERERGFTLEVPSHLQRF
jgi:hypothetical protein